MPPMTPAQIKRALDAAYKLGFAEGRRTANRKKHHIDWDKAIDRYTNGKESWGAIATSLGISKAAFGVLRERARARGIPVPRAWTITRKRP